MLVDNEADLLQDGPFIPSGIPTTPPKSWRRVSIHRSISQGSQIWYLPTNNTNPSKMCFWLAVSFVFQFQFCWSRSSWQDAYSIHRCSGSDLGVQGSVTCVDTLLHHVCTIPVFTTSLFCVYMCAGHSAPLHRFHCDVRIVTHHLAYHICGWECPTSLWTERTSPATLPSPLAPLLWSPILPPLRNQKHPPPNENPDGGDPSGDSLPGIHPNVTTEMTSWGDHSYQIRRKRVFGIRLCLWGSTILVYRQSVTPLLLLEGQQLAGGRPPFSFYKCRFVGYRTLSSSTRTYIVKHQKIGSISIHQQTPAFPSCTSSSTPFLPPLWDCQHLPSNKNLDVGIPLASRYRFLASILMSPWRWLVEMLTAIVSEGSVSSLFACTFRVDDDIDR